MYLKIWKIMEIYETTWEIMEKWRLEKYEKYETIWKNIKNMRNYGKMEIGKI